MKFYINAQLWKRKFLTSYKNKFQLLSFFALSLGDMSLNFVGKLYDSKNNSNVCT